MLRITGPVQIVLAWGRRGVQVRQTIETGVESRICSTKSVARMDMGQK